MSNEYFFDPDMLPVKERESARTVVSNLLSLKLIVKQFESALRLCDFSEQEKVSMIDMRANRFAEDIIRVEHNMLMSSWSIMSARAGAIAIYELYQICQVIDFYTSRCNKLKKLVDAGARKKSARLFSESFPDFAPVRHFAAHGQEMTAKPEDFQRHAASQLDIPGFIVSQTSEIMINGALIGRRFTSTYEGREVSYEITQYTLEILMNVVSGRIASFLPAYQFTYEKGLEQWKQRLNIRGD